MLGFLLGQVDSKCNEDMAEIGNVLLNDDFPDGSLSVATDHATSVRSAEDNNQNTTGKEQRHANTKMLRTVSEDTLQPDEDESAEHSDSDELETDDDDITSKLLSIQVLPRIPKRKPITDNSSSTAPAGETASYYSVLERVNSSSSSESARYPNWSAAGWSRSNIDRSDRPVRHWSRRTVKDKKTESKHPVTRSVFGKQPGIDVKHKSETSEIKSKPVSYISKHSAWSPDDADVSDGPDFSEIDQISADEKMIQSLPCLLPTLPSIPGPLPTLPFEEQMRERARLRNLNRQGASQHGDNNSSETTKTVSRNSDSIDSNKDTFVSASFFPEKTDASKLAVTQKQQDFKVPSFENSTVLSHTKSSERQQPSQRHQPSENGRKPSNKPIRHPNKTSATDKASQLHISRTDSTKDTKRISNSDEPIPKLKKERSSPPLPHLPVLPLFATSVSETSNSSLHHAEKKTTGISSSGKKTATLSSSGRNISAGNRLKSSASAVTASGAAASKNIVFNSSKDMHVGGGETKTKSKPNVSLNHRCQPVLFFCCDLCRLCLKAILSNIFYCFELR